MLCAEICGDLVAAQAQEVYQVHTRVELISEQAAIQPGRVFWVGLRMKTDPHWHTYWRNPGDSGATTTIKWDLPAGFSASDIFWPYPLQFEQQGIASFGYGREVVLLTQMTPPAQLPRQPAVIKARVDWLACEVPCLPGQADLSLSLPVAAPGELEFTSWKPLFDQARRELPRRIPGWDILADQDHDSVVLTLQAPDQQNVTGARFFPYRPMMLRHAAEQQLKAQAPGKFALYLVKDLRGGPNTLDRLQGAAVLQSAVSPDPVILDVDVPIASGAPVSAALGPVAGSWGGGLVMLAFAFAGGILLNLMPCFFPVLSIKVLHYVNQSRDRRDVLINALGYAAGIAATFLMLACVLIVLRAGGAQLGWGFQFQSPYFVTAMAMVLFSVALNFFGVFELNSPAGVSVKAASGRGLGSAFASGILAVIVATPCAAPFMGAAVSYALTQTVLMNLAVFLFLGLGLAFPFVLLCMVPRLVHALPRPGPWMEYFKKSLGFVMLAFVLWLLWVLSGQKEAGALVMVLFSLLVLSIGLWIWGISSSLAKPARWKCALAVLVFSAGIALPFSTLDSFGQQGAQQEIATDDWIPYDARQLARWEQQGKTVFLDFYARWCLTCQVNQKVALDQPSVRQHFNQDGVIAVKADWTNKDPAVTQALARFGRATLPTYVVLYGPSDNRQEMILPKMLTPGIVKQALETVNQFNKGG